VRHRWIEPPADLVNPPTSGEERDEL